MAGKPVEGVDLTAYGFTSKFDHTAPTLPYLGKKNKGVRLINNFSLAEPEKTSSQSLPYRSWKSESRLDSIPYYQFSYPQDSVYLFRYPAKDSITQFAPFVYKDGKRLKTHIVYLDREPVFFSWSNNVRPYTFRVTPGYHNIRIRTEEHEITLDSILFIKGCKHIVSVSPETSSRKIKVASKDAFLSEYEKELLYPFIFPYTYSDKSTYRYIQQNEETHFLLPESRGGMYVNYERIYLAGPVSGRYLFKEIEGFSTAFKHQGNYYYDFSPGLLKMTSIDTKSYFPSRLSQYGSLNSLEDEVFTVEILEEKWEKFQLTSRRENFLSSSLNRKKGSATLKLRLSLEAGMQEPLNLILLQQEKPLLHAINPGDIRRFDRLPAATYRLMLLFQDGQYALMDSIQVRPNGQTILLWKLKELASDSFSFEISRILDESQKRQGLDIQSQESLKRAYRETFFASLGGRKVMGRVVDEVSKEPIEGVAVLIEGTTIGTLTDKNGNYSLMVPAGKYLLNVAMIGYRPQTVDLDQNPQGTISLSAAELRLDEVIVTGYGASKRKDKVASVFSVVEQTIQGRAAGVQIVSDEISTSLAIRGLSAISTSNPLVIINGRIYLGDAASLSPTLLEKAQRLTGDQA
ncbi:MAG: carboxypeptidase-like regulatory domain-containing protein, partial [Bacteroidota bacterium]